jgi:hypothetical protein
MLCLLLVGRRKKRKEKKRGRERERERERSFWVLFFPVPQSGKDLLAVQEEFLQLLGAIKS